MAHMAWISLAFYLIWGIIWSPSSRSDSEVDPWPCALSITSLFILSISSSESVSESGPYELSNLTEAIFADWWDRPSPCAWLSYSSWYWYGTGCWFDRNEPYWLFRVAVATACPLTKMLVNRAVWSVVQVPLDSRLHDSLTNRIWITDFRFWNIHFLLSFVLFAAINKNQDRQNHNKNTTTNTNNYPNCTVRRMIPLNLYFLDFDRCIWN